MKKMILFICIVHCYCYAQLTYTVEKKSYNDGDAYYEGYMAVTGESKGVLGNHFSDDEGNLTSAVPTFLGTGFIITPAGIYVNNKKKVLFIKNEDFATITSLKSATEVNLEKQKTSGYHTKEDQCYENWYLDDLRNDYDKYGIFSDSYFIYVMDNESLIRTIDIGSEGKRVDNLIEGNFHYGLYAKDKNLTLVKTNLEDGKKESKVISSSYANYSGGEFIIEGDKIFMVNFYGECSYNFMANTLMTKGDGIISTVINKVDLSVESESETALPDDYLALFKLSDNKVTDPDVLTMYHNGKEVWVITGNNRGLGSTSAVIGPMLVWRMQGSELEYIGELPKQKSLIPSSAKFFKHNDKTYLLFCSYYSYDGYKKTINLIDITEGMGDEPKVYTLDISKDMDFYFDGVSSSYLTPSGKLIFVGKGKNLASIQYVRIELPE